LPWARIVGSEVGHKIVFQKHPGAADLRSGHAARLGTLAQLLRMDPKKVRGLGEVIRLATPARPWRGQGGERSDARVFQFAHGTNLQMGGPWGNAVWSKKA
jgi:hypothetical protein